MKIITRIDSTENVAIVSFEKAQAHIDFVSTLFLRLSEAKINIDMISQTPQKGDHSTVSFTVCDELMSKVLTTVGALKQGYPDIQPLISTGNVKISLFGEDMPIHPGVAAGVFAVLAKESIDTLLITTSEVDISIVVSAVNADKAHGALEKAYLQ